MREAITNVVRHSGARHCWIRVTAGLVEAVAEVTDDGVGQVGGDPTTGAGNGLAGLAERVATLRGRVEARTGPDGGFRLRASVPTAAWRAGGPG